MQAHDNKYVCAEGGGGREVVANRLNAAAWEMFTLYDVSGDGIRDGSRVALRAHNGQYVCAENGGGREIVANRDNIDRWETFTIEFLFPNGRPQWVVVPPAMEDGIFEGGGALGVAYIGALKAFQSNTGSGASLATQPGRSPRRWWRQVLPPLK